MSLRAAFKTSKTIETKGVEIDYGTSIFTIARAGGSNKAYKKALAKALKPFRAAIEAEVVDDARALPALVQCFADHVVLGCKVRVPVLVTEHTVEGDEDELPEDNEPEYRYVEGLEGEREGDVVDFNVPNLVKLLLEMPELYRDLQDKAVSRKLFLEDMEEAAKN